MSSIRFGVMNENAGRLLLARSVASWVYGTSSAAQVAGPGLGGVLPASKVSPEIAIDVTEE